MHSNTVTATACPLKRLKAKPELKVKASPKGPTRGSTSCRWSTTSDVVTRSATTTTAGDGERQHPESGQRRDKPPLLQATQSRA